MDGTITRIAIGAALALSAWCLVWMFNANAQITLLKMEIDRISKDTREDQRQNVMLRNHWRLHGWARDRLNDLRTKHDLGVSSWPDLE